MAGNNNGSAVNANAPNSNRNTVVGTRLVGVAGSSFKKFTLFPRFPPELRFMIWEFAMAMEKPRLVHLVARRCGIPKGRRRYGCPRSLGPKLMIHGAKYEQVPVHFFVNRECRRFALKHYSIRFSVTQERRMTLEEPLKRVETNIVMSPTDILVSWYPEELPWNDSSLFNLQFGPKACLVSNVMACPWYDLGVHTALSQILQKLGNVDAVERVFVPRGVHSPIKYADSSQFCANDMDLPNFWLHFLPQELKQRLFAPQRANCLELWAIDYEVDEPVNTLPDARTT
ncbi:hypothetical protein E0Z10_g1673 [Xylaria hypoxylon]|uniref:2EXR domain-containing protein n=1 Tax=Xylaria hypoxylon TaxID=37992 RepID=A0A4Z0Z4C7_9PEZI|nr:hypothetical protein E0Z10_g1673 [Xylaria hypoxylon]